MSNHVLALDLGTGGPKAAVVNDEGKIVSHGFSPVPMQFFPHGGAEQDPEAWWEACCVAVKAAMGESGLAPSDIAGIGCTAQWSGTVAVDAHGKALGNAISWMDSRGAPYVRKKVKGGVNVAGYGASSALTWIRKSGGAPSLSGKDPVGHIMFLANERPEIAKATATYLEPVDYLNLRLTGLARATYDTVTLYWATDNRTLSKVGYNERLLSLSGLDRAQMPELVPTATLLGELTEEAAKDLGLAPGIPVATGTGDMQSAAVGSGAVADYAGHLYIGTSSWISCHIPMKRTSIATNMASIPSGIPGRYMVADEHETAGVCLTWLLDLFGGSHDELNETAAGVPLGANGVLFTPWLNGERSPVDDHTIRGGFHHLALSNTKADMVRAVFEGVALNNRWLLEAVEKFLKRPFPALNFIGGGAKSDLWCQIHADATGRTIRQVADPVFAGVRGAAILTWLTLGKVKIDDVPAMVPIAAEYHPSSTAVPHYDALVEQFVEIYGKTKPIHRKLEKLKSARSSSRAPSR